MKKTIKILGLGLVLSLMAVGALANKSTVNIVKAQQEEVDLTPNFDEDFESYTVEGNVSELGTKWTNAWFTHMGDFDEIACDDSHFKVVADPEDSSNKVLYIDTETSNESFYYLTIKDLKVKNFELTYRYYLDYGSVESPWFGITCRKPIDGRYNGVTNVLLTTRAWGPNTLGFQSYRSVEDSFASVDIKGHDLEGNEIAPYGNGETAPVHHTWVNVKISVVDSLFKIFINDNLIGCSEITKKTAQNYGYVSFVSCVEKCMIDDVHLENLDEKPEGDEGNNGGQTQAKAPTIEVNEYTFEEDKDVEVNVSLFGEQITSLKQGANEVLSKYYSVEGDKVIISKEYVKTIVNSTTPRKTFILTTAGGSVSFFINAKVEQQETSEQEKSEQQSEEVKQSETTAEEKPQKGCKGEATASLLSLMTILGLVLSKKRK